METNDTINEDDGSVPFESGNKKERIIEVDR